ncbi:MAG: hypothetical protein EXQ67_00960 [Thermoleophilia bacterium]|nr:hypothetical protein [Thermoleophilia bacterium]
MIEGILERSEEADQILLGTIAALSSQYETSVGIRFIEEGTFSDGPWAGEPGTVATEIAIRYDDELVAMLVTPAVLDAAAVRTWEQIGNLISAFCLVGWDIGGEDWEP